MWTMLELTKASQVANAELIGQNPIEVAVAIEAAVDRVHDEVWPYSTSCAVCLTCIFWLKHISIQVGSGSIGQPQHSGGSSSISQPHHSGGSGQRPSCGCTLA
jgi:hypothetical protein